MVKIIDVGQTMRAPGLYRVAKDYVIKERVNVNPYNLPHQTKGPSASQVILRTVTWGYHVTGWEETEPGLIIEMCWKGYLLGWQ